MLLGSKDIETEGHHVKEWRARLGDAFGREEITGMKNHLMRPRRQRGCRNRMVECTGRGEPALCDPGALGFQGEHLHKHPTRGHAARNVDDVNGKSRHDGHPLWLAHENR